MAPTNIVGPVSVDKAGSVEVTGLTASTTYEIHVLSEGNGTSPTAGNKLGEFTTLATK